VSQQPPAGPPQGWQPAPGEPTQPLPKPPEQGWGQQPPRPPRAGGLPWYKRWWWAVALTAFVLGAAIGGASQPEPEVRTETVTQVSVSERTVWTPECEKLSNQSERDQCEGIMAGYNKSLQSAATTTTKPPAPKPTQPPAATIEQGTWAVPDEVKPGTYVSDGGEGCYWARLRDLTGGINSIIANGGDVGRQRVTILRSDKGFETNECGVWRKVG
jgi:hypothetical protein